MPYINGITLNIYIESTKYKISLNHWHSNYTHMPYIYRITLNIYIK